jgi:UDP-glucose 4-epimerase
MENWLIIGGCGYIGSEIVRQLINEGKKVTVLDDLSTGFRERISLEISFVHGDASDWQLVQRVCSENGIDGVINCAGKREARESVLKPTKYWYENLSPTLGLVRGLQGTNVSHVIFSSSCSVYGAQKQVTRESKCNPISPYGFTKLYSEQILKDTLGEQGRKLTLMRYFNVIGASGDKNTIDITKGAIIPVFVNRAINNQDIQIFGGNFNTLDGTAIRDYIDVRDLAAAHRLVAVSYEREAYESKVINVSSGKAISNLDIASEVLRITKSASKIVIQDSVKGDPEEIWGVPSQELLEWGWTSKFSHSESIQSHFDAVKATNSELNSLKDI